MIALFLGLFIFWTALTARWEADVIIVGLILSLGITLFSKKYVFANNIKFTYFKKIGGVLQYLIVLIIEVWNANMEMIRIVLFEDVHNENPGFAKFNTNLKTDIGKTALAHAITLTPGTITIGVHDDTFYVTSMNEDMLDGIDESNFLTMLHKLESE